MSGDMPRKPNNELAAYSRAVNRQTFSANLRKVHEERQKYNETSALS